MSSAATAGPPNRHQPRIEDVAAGGSYASNGVKAGFISGTRDQNHILPHIDDLLAAKPDINALAPIRKLLTEGESYAKQADTHLDFRRPDIALQEYIKASIIIVDIIPRHKDYPELKSDRGDLHRLHARLQKRISLQNEKFEEIKELIKRDNARSGVHSTARGGLSKEFISEQQGGELKSRPLSGQIQSAQKQVMDSTDIFPHAGDAGLGDVAALPSPPPFHEENASTRRKPPVQPKPDALHGKSIKSNMPDPHLAPVEEDLATRFSRLRGPSHSPAQDPRIRTRPIGMPDASDPTTKQNSTQFSSPIASNIKIRPDRPLGPRDMPKTPTGPPLPQKVPINVEIPSMPKLPDAIYSPARNSENPASLDMLRSTSRNVFGGSGRPPAVAPTTHMLRSSSNTGGSNEQSAHSLPNGSGPKGSLDRKLPDALTVTAEELMEYLHRGSHELYILLVDIRDRTDFDNGHIMSHSIICIEPIILRKEISAEELGQSLVLSPDAEQNLFDARDTFDLVVYYDQSSTSSEYKLFRSLGDETILGDFSKAVYDYGYEKRLKRPPRLLVGGLDAWVDLLGRGALETTRHSSTISSRGFKSGAQHSSGAPKVRGANRLTSRGKTHEARPLSKEEQSKWEEALKEDAAAIDPDALNFIKTTEDFFRRYPEPSAIQESMVSPSPFSDLEKSNKRAHGDTSVDVSPSSRTDLALMPQIPTRPAPALPRQSYSGVSERTKFLNPKNTVSPFEYKETATISHQLSPHGRTGLVNPGNLCYMNSVFQALKGTQILRHYILGWSQEMAPVPLKPGEKERPKQLLMQSLKIMLTNLCSGQHKVYNAKSLKNYIYDLHNERMELNHFGGRCQQDADEFLGFLLQELEQELNVARNKGPLIELTTSQEQVRRQQLDINSCWMEWLRFLHTNNSFISRNFRGQIISTYTCQHCKFVQKSWESWQVLQMDINGSLQQSLHHRFLEVTAVGDYRCDNCKQEGSNRRDRLSRCPEICIFTLKRALYDLVRESGYKKRDIVPFPLEGLSLDPYFISLDGRSSEELENGFLKPFTYDCYAIIQHLGSTIKAGHYWAFVKEKEPDNSGKETWFKYEDERVTRVADIYNETQKDERSYILFYQRRKILDQS